MRWFPLRSRASSKQRIWLRALFWPLVITVAEIAFYYELPLDRTFTPLTILWLCVGVIGLGVFAAVQIVQTSRSQYPRMRAVIAIVTTVPIFLLLFAGTYYMAAHTTGSTFNETLSRTDSLYFTLTVFSTVGFGDIVPTAEATRVIVMFQMIGDLVLIAVLGRAIARALGLGLARRDQSRAADADDSVGADD